MKTIEKILDAIRRIILIYLVLTKSFKIALLFELGIILGGLEGIIIGGNNDQ